jgi:ethanolamine utilization protein EutQ (cupin superfamily)
MSTPTLRKLSLADATFERSPGQDADIFAANLVDQRHGGPVTIGFGRYGANQSLQTQIAVHDVMIVLEGQVSVSTTDVSVTAGPGEIIYMPKGVTVHIRSLEQGALTAYVTYPHWQEP